MSDATQRRLEALERQYAGMLKQRLMDRDRIAALEARCEKLEAAVLELARHSFPLRPGIGHEIPAGHGVTLPR